MVLFFSSLIAYLWTFSSFLFYALFVLLFIIYWIIGTVLISYTNAPKIKVLKGVKEFKIETIELSIFEIANANKNPGIKKVNPSASIMKKDYPNAKVQDYNKNGTIDTWYIDENKNGKIDTAFIDDNEANDATCP